MKDLFSTTTSAIPRSHTEIVEAIKQIDIVNCDVFHAMVGRAINTYFEADKPLYKQVPDQTRSFARLVTNGIKTAVDYVSQENEPMLSLKETVGFTPLLLRTNMSAADKELDDALAGILKSMDQVTYYQGASRETFLFRVSLLNGSRESLIPEITRTNNGYLHRPDDVPNVAYDLTFAAFED